MGFTPRRTSSVFWRLLHFIGGDRDQERALEYLREFGESFWQDTEYRIQEVTNKLEQDLEGSIKGQLKGVLALNASSARKLTEEEKAHVIYRGQDVVNKVQIRELSKVLDLLDEVLADQNPQQRSYITVDGLDEDWAEDRYRFRLIHALIRTALDFARVRNVKVIVAIRQDLLDRVIRFTRGPGYQEEKYSSNVLTLRWDRNDLVQVLDTRINMLVREQYTTSTVTHRDLLPPKVGRQASFDYMLERTHLRPRDIIEFFNICIAHADGKPRLTERIIREAEGVHSDRRFRALADEWTGIYPHLLDLARILRNRPDHFLVSEVTLDNLDENFLQIWKSGRPSHGIDSELMKSYWEGNTDFVQYRASVLHILYRAGVVGLKTQTTLPVSWSFKGLRSVSSAEVADDTRVYVHPTFWRVLGIPGLGAR